MIRCKMHAGAARAVHQTSSSRRSPASADKSAQQQAGSDTADHDEKHATAQPAACHLQRVLHPLAVPASAQVLLRLQPRLLSVCAAEMKQGSRGSKAAAEPVSVDNAAAQQHLLLPMKAMLAPTTP
jgi:hypothetical protein